ncbi:MAG: DUF2177 family protein [Alphaproteobacteria bacterium]
MTIHLSAYAAAATTFFALDMLWLGVVARGFYRRQLGALLRDRPGYAAAAGYGALLGLLCYGTYDVTNLATLRGWPFAVTIVDIAWGSVLTGTAATMAFLVATGVG